MLICLYLPAIPLVYCTVSSLLLQFSYAIQLKPYFSLTQVVALAILLTIVLINIQNKSVFLNSTLTRNSTSLLNLSTPPFTYFNSLSVFLDRVITNSTSAHMTRVLFLSSLSSPLHLERVSTSFYYNRQDCCCYCSHKERQGCLIQQKMKRSTKTCSQRRFIQQLQFAMWELFKCVCSRLKTG